MFNIKTDKIKSCVRALADNVRAENIDYESYIALYSGTENIENINNKNNTVIYGRRGSGKTHLLRALRERMIEEFFEKKNFPVYVDLRRIVPILPSDHNSADIDSILIFKYITQEISHTICSNIALIFNLNKFDAVSQLAISNQQKDLIPIFEKIYLEFDGREFKKPTSLSVSEEEIKSLGGAVDLSMKPSLVANAALQTKTAQVTARSSHISILDITNVFDELIKMMGFNRITVLIDEWSEIETGTQIMLAEIIKKSFSAINVSVKIAAIPNRTNLGIKTDKKFFGLEDGGDIFGYPLDSRYVFEVNKAQTRDFFNDLLYRHLSSIDRTSVEKLIEDNKTSKEKIINLFFANVSLSEILVACAGIPRDFMNLFLNAYDKYLLSSSSNAQRISVRNLRSANSEWYVTDKKEQIDKNPIEKQLLAEIVKEVIEKKKSIHFLIPERHSQNRHIQNLIDFRVIHLRRSGYSHQDHSGVSYNVYSIDYGCYNSLNITRNKLDSSAIDNLNVKELRDIRRISLEDTFFQRFLMSIGEAFSCPHCNKPIDTNHLAFIKQSLCNNCYEKVDSKKSLRDDQHCLSPESP